MRLLTDRSLEIPPFLQRNADGSMKYPDMPVAHTRAPVKKGRLKWIETTRFGAGHWEATEESR
jgi:hypothetical protein